MIEVHLKKDQENYFLGRLIREDSKYLVLEAVDENGYLGGIYFIKKFAISEVKTNSDEIEDLRNKIIDPFSLKKNNEELLLEDKLLDEYLNAETSVENSDLVEIDLKNQSAIGQDEFLVGKIIKEDKDSIIIESLNDLGQLDSITAIKTPVIKKIVRKDNYLNYVEFLKQWQKKNQSYDLKKIQERLENLDLKNLFQTDAPIIDLVK